MSEKLVGRTDEIRLLNDLLITKEAELVAVYGRRRVGKTFLIRRVYGKHIIFEMSGLQHATTAEQIKIFTNELRESMGLTMSLAVPEDWIEAFELLKQYLRPLLKDRKQKKVIFFDEFPWIHSPRSGFLQAFDHFWNSWCTKQDNLVVIICGSVASWMIRHIINNKGGLHNRVTQRIALAPFTLQESETYLKSRRVNLNRYHILQLYMALGGIPHYLKAVRPGETSSQAIDRLCFQRNGLLRNEFSNLYSALFRNADKHITIVRELADRPRGMTRSELIERSGITTGGAATKLLEELTESGFISSFKPFQRKDRDTIYRLTDEYSRFYFKFIANDLSGHQDIWNKQAASPAWRSWSGTAFEEICLKHTYQIKQALGISGLQTTESSWRHASKNGDQGAQIDLLIDRQDFSITICEIKFSTDKFTIDKRYASELQHKLSVFRETTKTRKNLFLIFITTFGLTDNANRLNFVQQEITMDALFS